MKTFFCLALLFAAAVAQSYVQSADELDTPLRVRVFYSDGEDSIFVRLLSNQKLSASATDRQAASLFQLAKKASNPLYWTLQDVLTESFVSAESKGKKSLRATRPHDRTWETLEVEATATAGMFKIKSRANGKYFVVTEFDTITARVATAEEATSFGFEHFTEASISPVLLRSIRQAGTAAAVNDAAFTLTSTPATTYVTFRMVAVPTGSGTGSVRRALAPVTYTKYTLQSTATQKYLCYDGAEEVSVSCTDKTATNTHFHFLNGAALTADYVIVANDLGHFLKLDSNGEFKFAGMDTDATTQFEIAENAPLPDASNVVFRQYTTQQFWTRNNDAIELTTTTTTNADSFRLVATDRDMYKYQIISGPTASQKFLTVDSNDQAILDASASVSDSEWEIVNTGNNYYRITSLKNNKALIFTNGATTLKATAEVMSTESSWVLTDLNGKKKRFSPVAKEI